LPFMLFALFPGWLNSLPRSGGWMNTVKVSLGFLELALAFKFLSKADLVTQSHILEREVFLAIWIAVFGAWALYLFGKLLLPHDTPGQPISVGRLLMGLFVLSFTIYLVPGLWGAPLKILSGFPPPLYYSESPYGVGVAPPEVDIKDNTKIISHGLLAYTDYEAGLKYAKSVNKPVFLDFTGHGCENCRKMEDYVWSDPRILSVLKNDVVIISLYVDEKKELPENQKYKSPATGKKIKTVGNKWSDFQITRYKVNIQPYYLILDTEGNTISVESASYNPDIEFFYAWLKSGIANFSK
jgi:thiol:disulfide interchange protein